MDTKSIEHKRCFICIDFDDEVIKEVARVQEVLGNLMFDGKPSELENLHLTLKFLGEIDNEKIEMVKERLKKVEFSCFEGKLMESGVFNFMGKPRIVWIKVGGKGIFDLQKKVDEALKDIFKMEERFMSHMTIARVKYVKDKKGFVDYVEKVSVRDIKFNVKSFRLMSSVLTPNGPVHTLIEEYPIIKT